MNLADCIDRNKLFFSKKEALIFGGKKWTNNEIWAITNKIANGLTSLGISKGDKVSIFTTNIPEFIFSFWGILKIGAVAVSISAFAKKKDVEYFLNDSESKVLIVEDSLFNEIPLQDKIFSVTSIITVNSKQGNYEFNSYFSQFSENFKTVNLDRSDEATIIYTSGTTGVPKGVVLTHENLVAHAYSVNHTTGMGIHDRLMCFLPLYHSFAQNFIMTASFNQSSTIILHKKFEKDEIMESIKNNRATRFFAVPTIYIALLNDDKTKEYFQTVNYTFSAASSLPEQVAKNWFKLLNLKIYEGYGLTETSPFASYNHEIKHKTGSIGAPVENVEMGIIDDSNNFLEVGETGEIVIKGPNVMKGYYKKDKETADTIFNGWLKTGDIGYRDEEGYFYIVDRKKDMINSAGLKVWPREVEEILYKLGEIQECAVIPSPDDYYGEIVKACIVLKKGEKISEERITEFCKKNLSKYKVPKVIEFMDELPKNPTGKILKRVLKERELKLKSGDSK
jgi:long-chain acyl-CoA synthetase